MIIAENICKTYITKNKRKFFSKAIKSEKEVVKNLNLKVEKGQIVGVLGINGAGKTTTIKMLTTMIEPTSGKIQIDGIDAIKNNMEVKKHINLITGGERNIYWRLTAQENLEYFGNLYGIPKTELQLKIKEILELLDLYEKKDVPVERYSKGMKQRLQIARGLINNPDYIFMDEPTLGLDILIAKEVREYVKKIAYDEDKGIVLTTHYIAEAEELCDYIYVINEGRLIFEGTADELKKKYNSSHKWQVQFNRFNESLFQDLEECDQNFIEIKPDYETNEAIIESKKDEIINIIEWANQNNIKICHFTTLEISLEDALFRLMEESVDEVMA